MPGKTILSFFASALIVTSQVKIAAGLDYNAGEKTVFYYDSLRNRPEPVVNRGKIHQDIENHIRSFFNRSFYK